MRGLALEGGGARGAYHIGVAQALMENGYEFDGFVGTSIGAINAAILAQDELDTAFEVWQNISMDKIFDLNERFINLIEKRITVPDSELPFLIKELLTKLINDKGIGTDKMKDFLRLYIDEEKIRASGRDFGLVTVCLNTLKPHKLMIEDIPKGYLINYLMASASFPGFRNEMIGDASFIDGAFHDNCPYNLLCDIGYDEVIAIRTNAPGIFHKIKNTDKVKVISPDADLGHIMLFTQHRSKKNLVIGYYDGMNYIQENKLNK